MARISASIRSRTPPCPGSKLPESLIPALRLYADSRRSPTCPAMLPSAAIAIRCGSDKVMKRAKIKATISEPRKLATARKRISSYSADNPLRINEREGTSPRPEPVGPMPDSFAQREILKERQKRHQGNSQRNDCRRTPQDKPHGKGNQQRGCRHSLPSHRNGIPEETAAFISSHCEK